MYSVPLQNLNELGISVLEFHPPAHGRSTGQMTMAISFHCFNWIMKHFRIASPIFLVGHSAGVNALVQYQYITPDFRPEFCFYIQPVCDFAHSARFMYRHGYRDELLRAIGKWVEEPDRLLTLLSDDIWLDRTYWIENGLRQQVNQISKGVLLGEFLEDFYINNSSIVSLFSSTKNVKSYISRKDHWYNYEDIVTIMENNRIQYEFVDCATDHYFRGAWDVTWNDILLTIEKVELR